MQHGMPDFRNGRGVKVFISYPKFAISKPLSNQFQIDSLIGTPDEEL
jgi:hypothetical protein